jgi:hypothetical protein
MKREKNPLGMEKWLGPYTISEIPKLGTMTLVDTDDKIIGKYRQKNIKKYYEAAETELQVPAQRMMTKMRRMLKNK